MRFKHGTMTTPFHSDKKNLAPYLSSKGRVVLVSALFLLVSALPLQLLEAEALGRFMGIVATGYFAFLGLIYTQMLISWRALHSHEIDISMHCSAKTASPNQSVQILLSICNPYAWRLYAQALSFDKSPQLKLDDPKSGCVFDARACTSYTHQARCLSLGEASVRGLGLALNDAFGFFVLEFHVELRAHVDIIPRLSTQRARHSIDAPKPKRAKHHLAHKRHNDPDIDSLRQYQAGDGLRHIAWRASAKRQTLVIFEQQNQPSPSELTLIVDASLSMRAPYRLDSQESPLAKSFTHWPLLNDPNRQVSLIAYDENGADIICKRLKVTSFYRHCCHWLLAQLRWIVPLVAPENTWHLGLQELWKDLRLYRRIDYRKQVGKDLVIDVQSMALWCRLKLAEKALSLDDIQQSEDLLKASSAQSITAMIQDRRLTPAQPSMQHNFKAQCHAAWNFVANTNSKTQAPQMVIWISHFASPIPKACLKLIKDHKTKKHLSIQILVAPFPHETLCVNPLRAKHQRAQNLAQLEQLTSSLKFLQED